MKVIGTAGHVDHGKSTLIAALTGTHPDRLKEEQEREMTIDLGFGWLSLPDGEQVGIVDVPGHRDFIENMLAGVGGIDAVLLVIAADEGLMPQTIEHLAILDLLQISAGIIVLTKIDLAPDADWLDMLEKDVRRVVAGTFLQDAPCVRVSARSRQGLDQLLHTLARILKGQPPRKDLGRPRLPIDRVFSMPGFGTIVTGTLLDGTLAVGDEIEVLPHGLVGRIRGLQTHKQMENFASPGSRTAVNISGIEIDQVERGHVLAHKQQYQAIRRMDARFRLLKNSSSPVKHGVEVKFFAGTSESMAALRLLGNEELTPGEEGWVQLEVREPVIAIRGDRFILRRPSPGETLGGGIIVNPQPKSRHKRFDKNILSSLASLAQASPADLLLEVASRFTAAPAREIISQAQLGTDQGWENLKELLHTGQLVALEESQSQAPADPLIMAMPRWKELQQQARRVVETYHQSYPLRQGIPREELKSRLKLEGRISNAVMRGFTTNGIFKEKGHTIAMRDHAIRFDSVQQAKIQTLLQKFSEHPYSPPSVKDCQAEIGDELLRALIELDELVTASSEVIYRRNDFDAMVEQIRHAIQQKGRVSLAEVRDLFGTSRKYAQALLEHLDATGVTLRAGDFRKLK